MFRVTIEVDLTFLIYALGAGFTQVVEQGGIPYDKAIIPRWLEGKRMFSSD